MPHIAQRQNRRHPRAQKDPVHGQRHTKTRLPVCSCLAILFLIVLTVPSIILLKCFRGCVYRVVCVCALGVSATFFFVTFSCVRSSPGSDAVACVRIHGYGLRFTPAAVSSSSSSSSTVIRWIGVWYSRQYREQQQLVIS